jgi:hypothetical protein
MRFLTEGLNPFKIQTRFKVDLFLNFILAYDMLLPPT